MIVFWNEHQLTGNGRQLQLPAQPRFRRFFRMERETQERIGSDVFDEPRADVAHAELAQTDKPETTERHARK